MNPNYPYTNTNTHTNVNTGLHTNVPVVGVVGQPGHQHVNTVPYGNVGTTGVNHPTSTFILRLSLYYNHYHSRNLHNPSCRLHSRTNV